ncbi:MAG: hypothetical protein K2P80_14550 [Beijerinckiaceae bacterium]|nr:hypothetical protein [Beijerinckiaceae bacterium]
MPAAIKAIIATTLGLGLAAAVWTVIGWLLAGTLLEDVATLLSSAGVFIALTMLERLYNAIEQRGSSGH